MFNLNNPASHGIELFLLNSIPNPQIILVAEKMYWKLETMNFLSDGEEGWNKDINYFSWKLHDNFHSLGSIKLKI